MTHALILGLLGSSALVLGGALGAYWPAPERVTGVLLAFASGTLVAALAFELFPEAVELGGLWPGGVGLVVGAATFVVINTVLDSKVAGASSEASLDDAAAEQSEKVQEGASRAVGLALLAAVTLDGVPENFALGVSLVAGGSLTLLVAIFASNFPEALVGAVAMRRGGRSPRFAIAIWTLAAILLTLAVLAGRAALSGVADPVLAFALAFAGGAVLASLADTLMPEAFEHGRPFNSFATAAGFFISFVMAHA